MSRASHRESPCKQHGESINLSVNKPINRLLENVAIANDCNLRQSHAAQSLSALIFVARAEFEVAQPIRCRLRAFLLFICYVTM